MTKEIMAKTFDYYFDFGSLATYLAHTQMDKIKAETGASPIYLPMLLGAVLTYHVVAGKVMAADVKAGKVKTVQGSEITISTTSGVSVNNAKVIKTDIVADNGVIHVIDTVIMPK